MYILLTEMKKRAERQANKLLSICKSTPIDYKITILQDNNHQANDSFSHKSSELNDTHTTDYIHFSTVKKSATLENDAAPNWDRMWSLNGQ